MMEAKDIQFPTPDDASSPDTSTSISLKSFLIETIQTIVIALVLYFLIDSVIARVRVENISMWPTLEPGEFILVNRLAYRLGSVKNGDVVVFHFPHNPNEDYIKRIIGIPGDQVQIDHGLVFINGQQLDEPYINSPPIYTGEWVVPPDEIFVLGDNRNQSSDSHDWGFVPFENLMGRALAVYWPFNKLALLTHFSTASATN